jgi:cytochrome c biogenesis protein CcmG, thiol:disulfide interchange protein DsbE
MRAASWPAVLAAGALALLCGGCGLVAGTVGQAAPALVVQELDGETFDLAAMRGRVVAVNFWATWCPPCRKEMPLLDAFYRKYHARGFELIGLSADRPRDRAAMRAMMQSFAYPAAMLDDAKVNGFGQPAILPVTFIVDRNGIVRARLTPEQGPLTAKVLADLLLPMLSEPPASSRS